MRLLEGVLPEIPLSCRVSSLADKLFSRIVFLGLVVILLLGAYVAWDVWQVYKSTSNEDYLHYKPGEGELGLAELMALNPDVCGWLTVGNTRIDYPVVQGKDNVEYLNKDPLKREGLGGSLFLDFRNTRDFSDAYSIIYGHHVEGGAMFSDLVNFTDADYFQQHTTGRLQTLEGSWELSVFAVLEVSGYDAVVFSPVVSDEAAQKVLLDYATGSAIRYRDIGIAPGDTVVALSTCTNAISDMRTVVLARKEA